METNKPIIYANVDELAEYIAERVFARIKETMSSSLDNEIEELPVEQEDEMYGYTAIAGFLHVSTTTVWRYIQQGILKDSVNHRGKRVVGKKSLMLQEIDAYNKGF